MKVIVIGLGSMGLRRIRLIKSEHPEFDICGVDLSLERRERCSIRFGISTFESMEQAAEAFLPDAAVICTSPLSHAGIISACLARGMHVFTEINLVSDGYEKNARLAKEAGKVLFLSSTFLYRREIGFLESAAKAAGEPLLYTLHVGQYLPDWHPWESYKDYFIGSPKTNGCREILAINLPWIQHVFGRIEGISSMRGKLTSLDISYPDCCMALIKNEGGNMGTVVAELVAREPVFEVAVSSEHTHIKWNGKPEGLRAFDIEKKEWRAISLYSEVDRLCGYNPNTVENAYLAELEDFFGRIAGLPAANSYGFSEDESILAWIDRIEEKDI